MPKLIKKHIEQLQNELTPLELIFGIDNPNYLPYWLAYMPSCERRAFLLEQGSTFLDFDRKMLKKDFDWLNWQATI